MEQSLKSVFIAVSVFSLLAVSCGKEKQGAETDGKKSNTECAQGMQPLASGTTEKVIDIKRGDRLDSLHIEMRIPVYPDKQVNEAIMERLNEQIGGSYEGPYSDIDSFANHYASLYALNMKEMREEYELEIGFERNMSITKGYETDKFVTIDIQDYQFYGGAHGLTTSYSMTFRKSDGRQMGLNVLNSQKGDEEWNEMMRKGLMDYFEVSTAEELQECFFDSDTYALMPLPQAEPSFSEEGMVFTYQQYEIAAYAYGLPGFVIPYDKLNKYLNVTGRRLLER